MTRPLPPILLVDDEKNMRLSLSALLADDGYAVETVESAEQGEQLVDKREFLMLITDAHLGGISGYELLARVRKRRPDLPMLMITAYATPKLAAEAIKAGASVKLGCDHTYYPAHVAIAAETLASLAGDLK